MSFETVSIGSTSGKFKYILIEKGKTLFIRGDPNLEYHDQIFDKFKRDVAAENDAEQMKVLGGGKIQVDFEKKRMNVFGESQSFGPADHAKAKNLLQEKYPDFQISTDKPAD